MEMDYREKRKRICDLFKGRYDEIRMLIDAISVVKVQAERVDRIARALEKIVPVELAWYRNGSEDGLYLFNGKYYEPLTYDNLRYGLDDFLYEVNIPAVDRAPKFIYQYMMRVRDTIKEHELKPKLSLMCFTNCVVDMNKLKKYKHGPEHDCVKMYNFKYDRKEIFNCTTWNKFIGENYLQDGSENDGVLPEKLKRRILQMFLGACLVDRSLISFEYFMILQGTGANGKSVISRVLSGIFGEEEMLNIKLSNMSRNGDEGLRAVESMRGKRIIHSTESSRSDFKDMSVLKQISSGEALAGRALKSNIKMLSRPPLLMCNSNYRWKMDDFINKDDPDDTSVQRRAVILNFDKTIPVENRDTKLAEKMVPEYAGIFAWIVKGLVELKQNGWRLPEGIEGRVDMVLGRIRSSVIGIDGKRIDGSVSEWVKLMTMKPFQSQNEEVKYEKKERNTTNLYELYEKFCYRVGANTVSIRKFSNDLMSLGFQRERSVGSVYHFFVEDENIARKFDAYIPNIAESVSKSVFEGFYYTEEDFVNDVDLKNTKKASRNNDYVDGDSRELGAEETEEDFEE